MVFCRGDSKSIQAIHELLSDYGSISGHSCNCSKSLIYAGGMSMERHKHLADIIGFNIATPPFIYLGVLIFVGRPKACYFQPFADRIRIKLANWKAKCLSMAGRVQLVKASVLSSSDKKKLVTVAWKVCCKHQNEGGLGILSLQDYNKATNIHLCWNFLNDLHSWSNVLKARVLRNGRIIKYAIKSSLWHGIKEAYSTVLENCMWNVGSGSRVNFWLDNWLGEALSIKPNILLAFPALQSLLSNVTIPEEDIEDCLVWKNSKSGLLSLKEAYNYVVKPKTCAAWKDFPWNNDIPPAHSMIIWRYLHNKFPTDDNLKIRGFSFPSLCSLCSSSCENALHLFFGCAFAKNIWNWFCGITQRCIPILCMEECKKLLLQSWSSQSKVVLQASIACIFHQIWKARNKCRFEDLSAN
ncbi:uncharacterized protein LOC131637496 [Vicia villosa]|uniref:uncharacterized protein LOC131637496 n=1 Tax=Vicia villosa TaxID=3911 RepID=UPI00273CD32E|nr:uncharacterized protein LOC131637496 [Vicia villosa]